MNITLPDPNPGRCGNFRASRFSPGKWLRCLDYEAIPHFCSFEAESRPSPIVNTTATYQSVPPKPWVKPDRCGGVKSCGQCLREVENIQKALSELSDPNTQPEKE